MEQNNINIFPYTRNFTEALLTELNEIKGIIFQQWWLLKMIMKTDHFMVALQSDWI